MICNLWKLKHVFNVFYIVCLRGRIWILESSSEVDSEVITNTGTLITAWCALLGRVVRDCELLCACVCMCVCGWVGGWVFLSFN